MFSGCFKDIVDIGAKNRFVRGFEIHAEVCILPMEQKNEKSANSQTQVPLHMCQLVHNVVRSLNSEKLNLK